MKTVLFVLLALPLIALGDDAAVQQLPFLDRLVNFVNHLVGSIPTEGAVIAFLSVAVEMMLRLIKSDKPRSILFGLARAIEVLAQLFAALADGCRKLAVVMNKVIPQRLKSDAMKLEGPK